MSTRSLNKVMLIGNLTRDVDLRYTASGTPVASFGIATNRAYVDSKGKAVEAAEFINIVAWSKLAEICGNLLKKGMRVYVEGRLQTNSWEDAQTKEKKFRTEVVATEMIVLSQLAGRTEADLEAGTTNEAIPAGDFDGTTVDFDKLADSPSATENSDESKKKDKKTSSEEDIDSKGGEETPF